MSLLPFSSLRMNKLLSRSLWGSVFHSQLAAEFPTHDFLANITVSSCGNLSFHLEGKKSYFWTLVFAEKSLKKNTTPCSSKSQDSNERNSKFTTKKLPWFPNALHNFRVQRLGVLLVIWNWHLSSDGKMFHKDSISSLDLIHIFTKL